MKKIKDFLEEKVEKLNLKDYIFLIIILGISALISFSNLGDKSIPKTFVKVTGNDGIFSYKLDDVKNISKIRIFSYESEGNFTIYKSYDGENYDLVKNFDLEYPFSWKDIELDSDFYYVLIEGSVGSSISEIRLYDENDNEVEITAMDKSSEILIDEGNMVPKEISYKNSMYFDEIYFARTAYDYVNGLVTHDWVHPPLGKLIQAIPIKLFGMAPFYYRMAGNISGILLILVTYLLALKIFKMRKYAITASLIMLFDNFRLAQTRMGTIDAHLVLFILTSFYFMYCYIKNSDLKSSKKYIYLILSGLFIGCAIATKWTAFFAGLGLAIIYLTHLIKNKKIDKKIVLMSIVSFIIIPVIVYLVSYLLSPNLRPYEVHSISDLMKQTRAMFNYHSGLTEDHDFASSWYTWPLLLKPVWYHTAILEGNMKETIVGIGNPFIWWSGILAIGYLIASYFEKKDFNKFFIMIAILSNWLPYLFIKRAMFLYHFFPTLPFMFIAITLMLKEFRERKGNSKLIYIYLLIAFILFITFYPIAVGMPIANIYNEFLHWAPTWIF